MKPKFYSNLREIVRQHYTTFIGQCFSDNGIYAVALDSFNRFLVFSTAPRNFLSPTYWNVPFTPLCLKTIYNNSLIACGDSRGYVHFYKWTSVLEHLNESDTVSENNGVRFSNFEINDILALSGEEKFVIGCGNGSIHVCDVEKNKILHSFKGHSKQINKLAGQNKPICSRNSEAEFASCSNDGIVHLWDVRVGKRPVRTLHVSDSADSQVIRPNFSTGIYAIDLDDNFVVCGGGIDLGLWHLDSESLVCKLMADNSKSDASLEAIVDNQAILYLSVEAVNGQILAGGQANTPCWNGAQLYRFNYVGNHLTTLKLAGISSIRTISTFSNNISTSPKTNSPTISLIAGDSPKIFCLSELGYLSHSINTSTAVLHNEEQRSF